MLRLKIFSGLLILLLCSQLSAQTVVKMDMPPQANHPLEVVALFDEELPEGIPVVLGLMGYDIAGGISPYTYEWLLNGEVISTTDVAIFTPKAADDLVLNVTDNNICTASTAFNLKIASIEKPDENAMDDIQIYPTMVKDEIFIDFSKSDIPQSLVRIFDVSGKLVYETKIQGSTRIFPDLESGIYFVSVKVEGKHKVEKITAY